MLGLAIVGLDLHANDILESINCIEGWLYAGPAGKYNTFKSNESYFNNETSFEKDSVQLTMKSIGVQASGGLVFPIPYFLAVDGAYTKLYSSTFSQNSIINDISSPDLNIATDGNFYTYEFKGGYLINPSCHYSWTLYPFGAYNTDTFSTTFPHFPSMLPPSAELRSFTFNNKITFSGPAFGLGTLFALPYGFVISGEASWQFREFRHTASNTVVLILPADLILTSKQNAGSRAWLQGPRLKASLDYSFCGIWFVGLSGEWQHLTQMSNSNGVQNQVDVTKNATTHKVVTKTRTDSNLEVEHLSWDSLIWKASIGFNF